jgi:hypothetical protein
MSIMDVEVTVGAVLAARDRTEDSGMTKPPSEDMSKTV